jgi:hypothetical protein
VECRSNRRGHTGTDAFGRSPRHQLAPTGHAFLLVKHSTARACVDGAGFAVVTPTQVGAEQSTNLAIEQGGTMKRLCFVLSHRTMWQHLLMGLLVLLSIGVGAGTKAAQAQPRAYVVVGEKVTRR